MKIKHITLMILVVLGAVLFFQNTQVVSVKLLFWEVSMSGIIMFPLLVGIGFVFGYLVCKFGGKRR
ncbi:LapA family protein [bacterium]|nr:MAG: LapA family protein [bacterium]